MRQHPWRWVAAGLLLVLVGVTWYIGRVNSSHPAPWPMAGGDAGNRNHAPAPFPTNPKVLWSFPLGQEQVNAGPVIWTDGTLYVSSGSRLMAVDRNGKRRWTWESKSQVLDLALGRQGDLYALTAERVYALAPDGTLTWEAEVEIGVVQGGRLLVGQGGVIYASGLQYTYALTSSGQRKWRFRGENITAGPVEMADGRLVVMIGADLYVLTRNGDTDWHREVGEPNSTLAIAAGPDNRIFVNAGALYLLEANQSMHKLNSLEGRNQRLAIGKDYVQDGVTRYTLAGKALWSNPGENSLGRDVMTTKAFVDSQGDALFATVAAQVIQPVRMVGSDGAEKWRFSSELMTGWPAFTADSRICFVGKQPRAAANSLVCIGDQ